MPKMRMIPDNEKFSVSDTMPDASRPDLWRSRYAVRLSKGASRYELNTDWDFEGVTRDDLIRGFLQMARIDVQGRVRNMGESATSAPEAPFQKVHVLRDIINASRAPADPVEAAVRNLIKAGASEVDARNAVALLGLGKPNGNTVAETPQDADEADAPVTE